MVGLREKREREREGAIKKIKRDENMCYSNIWQNPNGFNQWRRNGSNSRTPY
jgi:hypothetical protein